MIDDTGTEIESELAVNRNRSRFASGITALILLGGVLPLAGTLFALFFMPDWRWDSLTAHSVDEALGAFAALTLGILLLMHQKGDGDMNHRTWIACGLIVMGIFDALHALPKPGQTFVWLHSLAVLFGGFFFAMVWLPQSAAHAMNRRWAVWTLAVAALLMGVLFLAFPSWVPERGGGGKFTLAARAINIIGGIFFLVATAYLVRLFYNIRRFDELLFASISLLFGISGILFELSELWDASWWFWHLLRLIAYLIALTYLFMVFQRIQTEQAQKVDYLNKIPSPIMVIDRLFRIVFLNESGAKLMQMTPDQSIGMKCYDLFQTPHCRTPECRGQQSMDQGHTCTGQTLLRNDDRLPIQYTSVPIKTDKGEVQGTLEYMVDVSGLKKAEMRLEESLSKESKQREDLQKQKEVLESLIQQIREGAENIASATAEIMASTQQQASTSLEQTSAVTQTTSTMDQTRQTSQQAASEAERVARMTSDSESLTEKGLEAVKRVTDGMTLIRDQVEDIANTILALSEQSQQIGKIIATVNDIADQSNLLALNAAIEAARAGEAGKGFSIVAGEVRSLAEQSRHATAQVREILVDIQKAAERSVIVTKEGTKRVEEGQKMALETGEAFRAINESIKNVKGANQQIAAASRQQSMGINQVQSAMESISEGARQNEEATRQVEEAAKGLDELAHNLKNLVKQQAA
jgi:methyl-accepting chemotaxis protein/PAS domain-containing protein